MAIQIPETHKPLPPMTLILGGAKSGKSRFAEELTERHVKGCVYLATAEAGDIEMAERIREHRARRGDHWQTVEERLELSQALVAATEKGAAVLVDCLTLWLGNLMAAERNPADETEKLIAALGQVGGPVIFVSNEVGLGIVPDNALARAFRDHAGRMHQRLAEIADDVFFVSAGLPMKLK